MSNAALARQYHPAIIWLHWIVFALMVASYVTMEFRGIFEKGTPPRELMKMFHYSFGLTILALAAARLWLRFRSGTPPVAPPLTPFLAAGAVAAHVALYLFMLVMPILGWITLSAEGHVPVFFGLPLFPIAGESEGLAEFAEETHEIIGKIGYALIGLHVAAAVYHQFIRRDDTVARMVPHLRK
jgi:cytochrome b561